MREEVNGQRSQGSSELRERRPTTVARSPNYGRKRVRAGWQALTHTGHGSPWGLPLVSQLKQPLRTTAIYSISKRCCLRHHRRLMPWQQSNIAARCHRRRRQRGGCPPSLSTRTSVRPPVIKSTSRLKHLTSKPSPREQKPINYFCIRPTHECHY